MDIYCNTCVCNSNNKNTRYYKHNINRKYLRKIMCKNPIAFQIKNTFF